MKRTLVLLTLLTVPGAMTPVGVQADIVSARSALSGGDPAEAVKLATDGDIAAQLALGEAYLTGRGVPRNAERAAIWFRKAAEAGDLSAQIMLAQVHDQGTGADTDAAEAARWLEKAALRGDAASQLDLGGRYLEGRGVTADPHRAMMWIVKAAAQGGPEAARRGDRKRNRRRRRSGGRPEMDKARCGSGLCGSADDDGDDLCAGSAWRAGYRRGL